MISFHRERNESQGWRFTPNWERAPIWDLDRIAKGVSNFAWSPIFFEQGYRAEKFFEASYWCGYDFESSSFTLLDAEKAFCDCKAIIGTTKSHQIAKGDEPAIDRFRVMVPWEKPIFDLRTYKWNMRLQAKRYAMDKACLDGARFFWRCRDIVVQSYEGYCVEVETPPDDFMPSKWIDRMLVHRSQATLPRWTERQLKEVVPEGTRSITFYAVAKDLAVAGFKYDEIHDFIINSPTYGGKIQSHHTRKKLDDAIKSGIRKVDRELATRGTNGR